MKRGAGSGRGEELRHGAARFAEWRRIRQPGMRIPVELWELDVELARRHGASRTSQALPVGYYAIQERVAATGKIKGGTGAVSPAAKIVSPATMSSGNRPTFVELPAFRGTVFVFRNRRGTAVKVLAYDGNRANMTSLVVLCMRVESRAHCARCLGSRVYVLL